MVGGCAIASKPRLPFAGSVVVLNRRAWERSSASSVLALAIALPSKLRVTTAETEHMPLYLRTLIRPRSSRGHQAGDERKHMGVVTAVERTIFGCVQVRLERCIRVSRLARLKGRGRRHLEPLRRIPWIPEPGQHQREAIFEAAVRIALGDRHRRRCQLWCGTSRQGRQPGHHLEPAVARSTDRPRGAHRVATAFAVAGLTPNPQTASNVGVTISFLLFALTGAILPVGALPGPPTSLRARSRRPRTSRRSAGSRPPAPASASTEARSSSAWDGLAVALVVASLAYRFTEE
jgi:hypothetical protein